MGIENLPMSRDIRSYLELEGQIEEKISGKKFGDEESLRWYIEREIFNRRKAAKKEKRIRDKFSKRVTVYLENRKADARFDIECVFDDDFIPFFYSLKEVKQ